MERNCDHCGRLYSARSARSKYCSEVDCKRDRERARNRRRKDGAEVVSLPVEARVVPVDDAGGPIEQATRAELDAAGRAGSAAGMNALAVARKLDRSAGEGGSSYAQLSKRHMEALDRALEGAQVAADPVDELRSRREAKLSAG